jgi:DNA-binding GntR family transcriptional regulator
LAKALVSGSPSRAVAAMREHVRSSRQEALERLQPYFELRKATGRTFSRSARRIVS